MFTVMGVTDSRIFVNYFDNWEDVQKVICDLYKWKVWFDGVALVSSEEL